MIRLFTSHVVIAAYRSKTLMLTEMHCVLISLHWGIWKMAAHISCCDSCSKVQFLYLGTLTCKSSLVKLSVSCWNAFFSCFVGDKTTISLQPSQQTKLAVCLWTKRCMKGLLLLHSSDFTGQVSITASRHFLLHHKQPKRQALHLLPRPCLCVEFFIIFFISQNPLKQI